MPYIINNVREYFLKPEYKSKRTILISTYHVSEVVLFVCFFIQFMVIFRWYDVTFTHVQAPTCDSLWHAHTHVCLRVWMWHYINGLSAWQQHFWVKYGWQVYHNQTMSIAVYLLLFDLKGVVIHFRLWFPEYMLPIKFMNTPWEMKSFYGECRVITVMLSQHWYRYWLGAVGHQEII